LELHKKSEEIQVNSLIYAMGPSADDVLTTLEFDEGEETKFDVVKAKLNLINISMYAEMSFMNELTLTSVDKQSKNQPKSL